MHATYSMIESSREKARPRPPLRVKSAM